MKKIILISGLSLLFFSSCKTSQVSSFNDDIYTRPSDEKQQARLAAEAKAKKESEQRAKDEEARLAQKAKDDANPYYQDPKSDPDDYYDYKYASRLNRFSDPVPGAGYYDSRYTNYYTYNQNPAMFGSSIYSSYNWMPSSQFGYYSSGISMGFGTGYSGYGSSMGYGYPGYSSSLFYGNPYSSYGYSPYGYSPYGYNSFGYGYYNDPFYSGYNSGYYNGYNNGFYNGGGWGYLNSFDANSGYSQTVVGPRGSNGGGNSQRSTTAGMPVQESDANERQSFFRSMAEKQESTPRFTESARTIRGGSNGVYNGNDPQMASPRNMGRNGEVINNGANPNYNINNNNTNANTNPRNGSYKKVGESSIDQNSNQNNPTNSNRSSNQGSFENHSSGGNQGGERSGGGGGTSSPRGGGGNSRPR